MKIQMPAATVLVAGLIGACTNLQAPHYDSLMKNPGAWSAPPGWTYYLPDRAFHIDLASTLTACEIKEGIPVVRMATTAAVTDRLVADHSAAFVIDSGTLGWGTKTTSLAVGLYDNGTLKSINAAAQDRTAEIAGNLVKTGLTIASLAGGVPIPAMVPFVQGGRRMADLRAPDWFGLVQQLCTQDALDAVKVAEAARADLDRSKRNDKAKAAEFKRVAQEEALLKAMLGLLDTAILSGDAAKVESMRNAVDRQVLAVTAAKEKAGKSLTEQLVDDLAAARKPITATLMIDWVPRSLGAADYLTPAPSTIFPSQVYRRWLIPAGACVLAWSRAANDRARREIEDLCPRPDSIDEKIWARLPSTTVDIRLSAVDGDKLRSDIPSNPPGGAGLTYRQPRMAKLSICVEDCARPSPDAALVASLYSMPQFGRLARLDLKNGAFEDNNLTATFAADGTLVGATYASSAALEKASQLMLDTAQGVGTLIEARRTKSEGAPSREVEAIKIQTQLYEELKKLEDAKRAYEASREPTP
jgi:hypothetical protein